MYDYAGVFVSAADMSLLKTAMQSMNSGARLDVVVSPAPASIDEAEQVVGQIYGMAPPRPSELDLVVRLDARESQWQHTFGESAPSSAPRDLQRFACVAVGGTWDHMHWGHRFMLTMAAFTAKTRVIVGVTGSELLVNKKYREALHPYDERARTATSFVRLLRPDLEVEAVAMHDMYGPTATEQDMQALVVSHESRKGGDLVNDKRKELGWNTLEIIDVSLVLDWKEKLSSTDLRREELEGSAP